MGCQLMDGTPWERCRGLVVKASGWQSFDLHFETNLRAFMAAPMWCSWDAIPVFIDPDWFWMGVGSLRTLEGGYGRGLAVGSLRKTRL